MACTQTSDEKSGVIIPMNSFKCCDAESPQDVLGISPVYIHLNERTNTKYSFSGIEKIIERNGSLYLLEERGRKLIRFSMDGEPLCVLDYRGRGPNEYLQITDFDVDNCGNVWITDSQKDKIFKYDKDFKMVYSLPFYYDIVGLHCAADGRFIVQIASWDKTEFSGAELVLTDSLFRKVDKSILAYSRNKDKNYVFPSVMSDFEGGFLYCNPIDENVYEITEKGDISNTYYFDFGFFSVPEKYKRDIDKNYNLIHRECKFLYNSYKINSSFIICGIHCPDGWMSSIVDRNAGTITYFNNKSSGYRLVGQMTKGSIWQLSDFDGVVKHPKCVKQWLANGEDVLALFYEKE